MRAYKLSANAVSAYFTSAEAEKRTYSELAREAFSALGESMPENAEISAYKKEGCILLFALKRKHRAFDITEFYPKIM